MEKINEIISSGETYIGIELGSTRIKAVLVTKSFDVLASGISEWENRYENGYYTYSLDDIHSGLRTAFSCLKEDIRKKYGVTLTKTEALGVSAMMHGYLAFDKEYNLLTPFRTWRNTTTGEAARELSEAFKFNIPQRWTVAHLYQAILNGEEHIKKIAYVTTLAGYVHYLLTGRIEVGIGDASGIFPLDGTEYDSRKLDTFDRLIKDKGLNLKIRDILPRIRIAGTSGAFLTQEGVKILDRVGTLSAGIPVCPPEGDAGTGMVATNSVTPGTGNISAGTSIFSMLVLKAPLKGYYPQIDIVATPDGSPVAMVHCNNCCGELDVWVNIFEEFSRLLGNDFEKPTLYDMLYNYALRGKCDNVISFNYLSGEHISEVSKGLPMIFRDPNVKMGLADLIKSQLYSSIATLKLGMDILVENENISSDVFYAHGGLFKVKDVAQQILTNALNTPVSVFDTSSEGGAWGASILAGFMVSGGGMNLGDWLSKKVFSQKSISVKSPDAEGVSEYKEYMVNYKKGLEAIRFIQEEKNV